MVADAEAQGPAWTVERDPRVTPVGRLLRRTALDELPELLSIWKGDMSFVGPLVGADDRWYRKGGRASQRSSRIPPRHPAGLNFGDCFSYAVAKATGEPLLCKGDDFNLTDLPQGVTGKPIFTSIGKAAMLQAGVEDALRDAARTVPGLRLLLLFGSRGRQEARPGADWDLGYLAGLGLDPALLEATLSELLGTDNIDVVDLARTSGLLRYRAAGEGRVLYADGEEVFDRFWMEAVTFWCDMAPILEEGYRHILERLPR